MSFFEERLDPGISLGARGGPQWSTTVTKAANGFQARNRNWRYPLHSYNIAHGVRDNADFEAVRAMFFVVQGMYDGFRYKDWADYKASAAAGTGVIITRDDGAKQLARRYTVGSRFFDRPISKPVAGTVVLVGGGVLDNTTGIVTGGAPTAWTGEFDVPVNFATDVLDAEIPNRDESDVFVAWDSCVLEEVRLP